MANGAVNAGGSLKSKQLHEIDSNLSWVTISTHLLTAKHEDHEEIISKYYLRVSSCLRGFC